MELRDRCSSFGHIKTAQMTQIETMLQITELLADLVSTDAEVLHRQLF